MNMVKNKRIFSKIVSAILLVSLLLPAGMITNEAQAATKPSIEATKKIGTGSIIANYDYYSKDDKYILDVSNVVKKATYSFTSSNAKVVTVKAIGSNGYLTGIKAGTATITCNQKLNGKTTKVGTCEVTVVNSSVSQDTIPVLPLGNSVAKEYLEYQYRNNDATYTFTSDNKNFSMKENLSKFDGMYFVKQSFTATAPGTYTVTVKETYNKSTRVVGKIKYIVKKATVSAETTTIDLGSDIVGYEMVNDYRLDVDYIYEPEDSDIIEVVKSNEISYLKGKKVGTTNINVYEDAKAPDKSKLVGTCKITVKEVVLESIDCDFYETEVYVGGEPIEVEVTKEPYNYPGAITVTSSDSKVATVSDVDEDGNFTVTPVSEGNTTITITCGTITKTQTITVSTNED